jgi:carbon monoxide dehydrogenase subunit G
MQVSVSPDLSASPAKVWKVMADVHHWESTISGIDKVEVLVDAEGPSMVGLKWREPLTMYGKSATETRWITAAEKHYYYDTRAESHGAVYTTHMALEKVDGGTRLSMTFSGVPQATGAKIMWGLRGLALTWIVSLAVLVVFRGWKLWNIRRTSVELFIPYLMWISFATALNASMWALNR